MRKIKKKFQKPRSPWDSERIKKENDLMKTYGLTKKREIWKAESILRSFRRRARSLAAKRDKNQEKILIDKLYRMGLLENGANLDVVLSLTAENLLERRLQTFVSKKNLANTIKHARQLITHGHIAVDGRKIIYPSFIVTRELEDKISFYKGSDLKIATKTGG
ncbi:MAG: 30S ribosomal protein S4 [Candidatus Aenigmarchaeota archaeon]|nr:30S ribosomal protein S4 [Candidatus Aenigmarchaeota archaeon]